MAPRNGVGGAEVEEEEEGEAGLLLALLAPPRPRAAALGLWESSVPEKRPATAAVPLPYSFSRMSSSPRMRMYQ